MADALQEGVMDNIFHETKGLISKGTEFKNHFSDLKEQIKLKPEQENIIHEVLSTFKDMSIDQLEILATTFFIYRQQNALFGNTDKDNVLDKVRRAKSSRFTEEQILNSYNIMENVCFPLSQKFA